MAKIPALALLLAAAEFASAAILPDVFELAGLKDIHWPKDRPMPLKITRNRNGQPVAWVRREAQIAGGVASPPAARHADGVANMNGTRASRLSTLPEKGPEGTVPFQIVTKSQLKKIPKKIAAPKPGAKSHEIKTRQSNGHWYGNSGQGVTNYGGSGVVSLFDPAVTTDGSMSLIQIGCTDSPGGVIETAELGWQVLPVLHNNDYGSYIFTYYTTNAYSEEGDNKGGYNTLQAGWVQVSDSYAPGITFSTISSVGGDQYEASISYQLYQGNWWGIVNGEWMGYYPGSLYARGGTTDNTLGSRATNIGFWGEVYDDPSGNPTTDMGSGQFADTGYGKAGYMHNIVYYSDTAPTAVDYNGAADASNNAWYTIDPHFLSGESWGSYFYVGGPGAG